MRIIIKVRINYRVEISGQFIYKVSERVFWVIWKRRFLKRGCSALKLMIDRRSEKCKQSAPQSVDNETTELNYGLNHAKFSKRVDISSMQREHRSCAQRRSN